MAQQAHQGRFARHVLAVPLEVQVECVAPGLVQARARFNLGEINTANRKFPHRLVQCAGTVPRGENNGCFGTLRARRIIQSHHEKARVVEAIILDGAVEDFQAIQFRRQRAGDDGDIRFGVSSQVARAACRIEGRFSGETIAGKILLALRQRLGMRAHAL